MTPLEEAICDLLWRVTPYGTDDDGNVTRYIVSAGTVHRLIGQAQGVGIPAALRVPELADEDYRDRHAQPVMPAKKEATR
jgi:hypothetical protein